MRKVAPPPLYPTFDSHSSGTSTGNPADQAGHIGTHHLDSTSLRSYGKSYELASGESVECRILIGEKRIIEPFWRGANEALRER